MMDSLIPSRRRAFPPSPRRGQGLAEYVIIVVVVGIFCIGIFMALGKNVQDQTRFSTEKLTGVRAHDKTFLGEEDLKARSAKEVQRSNLMTGQ